MLFYTIFLSTSYVGQRLRSRMATTVTVSSDKALAVPGQAVAAHVLALVPLPHLIIQWVS